MLAKTYKQQLEKMLAREDLQGKGLLKQFIWMNEVKPQYKKGDYIVFSSRGMQVYGNNVDHFVGVITDISLWPRDKIVHYQITFSTVSADGNVTQHTAYCNEGSNELHGKAKHRSMMNTIEIKDKYSDAIHI